MTSLPDWLVERAALEEVPPASRERLDRADPRELADRIAELREDSARELALHPAAPALAQIEARVAAARRRSTVRRRATILAIATSAAAIVLVVTAAARRGGHDDTAHRAAVEDNDGTRVKGGARLLAFRQAGPDVERLEQDAVVRAGDVIQLRYNAGGQRYGLIASLDGAGVVTLHFPASEDVPADATAVAHETTTLPHAYALDDAPSFERFFFITAGEPIDVPHTLAAVRALGQRADAATAPLELPAGLHQWSLRLRKP